MNLLNAEQKIVEVHGHYKIHTLDGHFILSRSTWDECYDDLKEMLKAEAQTLQSISA